MSFALVPTGYAAPAVGKRRPTRARRSGRAVRRPKSPDSVRYAAVTIATAHARVQWTELRGAGRVSVNN
jgi:hypothetical protein